MENLVIVLTVVSFLIILSLTLRDEFKSQNKFSGKRKLLMIIVFVLCSISYGKAQNTTESVAGNINDNENIVYNPENANPEFAVMVTAPAKKINSRVLKIDDNNSIIIQIENDDSNDNGVSIVKIIANGLTTQKLIFKDNTMSSVEFPGLQAPKNTPKRTNICE